MKKIIHVLLFIGLLSSITSAAFYEDFEDGDTTDNPTWTVGNPGYGSQNIMADPFRDDNLVLRINGTDTAHRSSLTPINIPTTGFYFEIEYAVSSFADDFSLIVGLGGNNGPIVNMQLRYLSQNDTKWMIAFNPSNSPAWIQQDPSSPSIPNSPIGEWWKIIFWNQPSTEIINGEIRRSSDNSLIWNRAVNFSSISNNEYITSIAIGIEELDSQYIDNFYLIPEPTTLILLGIGGLLLRKRKS